MIRPKVGAAPLVLPYLHPGPETGEAGAVAKATSRRAEVQRAGGLSLRHDVPLEMGVYVGFIGQRCHSMPKIAGLP